MNRFLHPRPFHFPAALPSIHGTLGLAIGAIEIDRSRRVWSAPGTIVTGIDPKPAGLGAAAAGIKHRDRGVVGKQLLRCEDVLSESHLQRLQPPAGAADPVGKGRAIQLDALARKNLALPIERKMIAVLGDQNMARPRRDLRPSPSVLR